MKFVGVARTNTLTNKTNQCAHTTFYPALLLSKHTHSSQRFHTHTQTHLHFVTSPLILKFSTRTLTPLSLSHSLSLRTSLAAITHTPALQQSSSFLHLENKALIKAEITSPFLGAHTPFVHRHSLYVWVYARVGAFSCQMRCEKQNQIQIKDHRRRIRNQWWGHIDRKFIAVDWYANENVQVEVVAIRAMPARNVCMSD